MGEGGVREVLVVRFMACTARLVAERGRGTVLSGSWAGSADKMRRPFSVKTLEPASISGSVLAILLRPRSLLNVEPFLTEPRTFDAHGLDSTLLDTG